MHLYALKKKRKMTIYTQNKTCPSDVNVSLNSETKLRSRLLVGCCTFSITQCYKKYAYNVLRLIRRYVIARRKNNNG
jgi:hypothetical protein